MTWQQFLYILEDRAPVTEPAIFPNALDIPFGLPSEW